MSHIVVRGFVLREQPVGETDKIINILTADHGLITASARGARRAKSPLLASTQIFALSDFQIFSYKGRYTVDSADLVESFMALHQDIVRLICAAHLAEVFSDILKDDLPDRLAYELWAYSAYKLQVHEDPLLIVHIAQLRLLTIAGMRPPVDICRHCHNSVTAPAVFSFVSLDIFCGSDSCFRSAGKNFINLSGGALACLHYVLEKPVRTIFSFELTAEIKKEIISFSENYLTNQMEKKYTRLDMLNDLI